MGERGDIAEEGERICETSIQERFERTFLASFKMKIGDNLDSHGNL